MLARRSAMNLYRAAEFLLGVMFNQSGTVMFNQPGTDFDVNWQWRAGTHFAQPLHADLIGKFPEVEDRDVNRVSFSGRGVFDEIAHASGTVTLHHRFARFYFYLSRIRTRPFVAVPCVAIHVTS
jgi:hypothetical protein